jgi:uncharacterized protein YaiE (UPF0345 family)
MPNLVVPKPNFNLKSEDYVDGFVKVEKPIKVECGKVKYPDGSAVSILEATKFGFYVYREESGQVKIWDKSANTWKPESGVSDKNKEFNMLVYDENNVSIPWNGLFIGLGEKYLSSSVPLYFVRCYFEATDSKGISYKGISSPSSKIKLLEIGSNYRVGINTEKRNLEDAKWIHLFVRDSGRKLIGEVKLKRESEVGEIEIISYDDNNIEQSCINLNKYGEVKLIGKENDSSNKTSVTLTSDGKVKIAVANNDVMIIESGKVTIKGNLEVNKVNYERYSDGTRHWL